MKIVSAWPEENNCWELHCVRALTLAPRESGGCGNCETEKAERCRRQTPQAHDQVPITKSERRAQKSEEKERAREEAREEKRPKGPLTRRRRRERAQSCANFRSLASSFQISSLYSELSANKN